MNSRLMLAVALTAVFTLVVAGALLAQQERNFSDTWELDNQKSEWSNPRTAPTSVIETVDRKDATLMITRVEVRARGESTQLLKLTTDGIENTNVVGSNAFQSHSVWNGNRLVTTVLGGRGMQLTETRSLSVDGKSQTVERLMPGRAEPMARLIMTRVEPVRANVLLSAAM